MFPLCPSVYGDTHSVVACVLQGTSHLWHALWSSVFAPGYGDIHPVNVQEMLFAIAYILWDLLFMAYIIGEFTALVVRGETATEALRNKLSAITKFCIR